MTTTTTTTTSKHKFPLTSLRDLQPFSRTNCFAFFLRQLGAETIKMNYFGQESLLELCNIAENDSIFVLPNLIRKLGLQECQAYIYLKAIEQKLFLSWAKSSRADQKNPQGHIRKQTVLLSKLDCSECSELRDET